MDKPQNLPEPIIWTPELVNRFWDGLAQAGLDDVMAFGRMARRCIHWVINDQLKPAGRHLDYGAGGGEVAAYLIERGYPFAVFEPSGERQRKTERLLADLEGFIPDVGPKDEGSFDAVTCFEVLEHVLDEDIDKVCDELAAYVRPGGRLIISTPNNEDLRCGMIYCPVSNKLFHRWQHVRQVTPEWITNMFAARGFTKICLHQLDFDENLFLPFLHHMGLAPAPGKKAGADIMPLHIHQVINNIDSIFGGATRLLYIGEKS
ncbi:MAG: class I SAM-dependent methyltransferase [Rhizobiales bacterium]|nr:class I SAM-dependent methyltransferase [Hyphomicrobiales bacterium]